MNSIRGVESRVVSFLERIGWNMLNTIMVFLSVTVATMIFLWGFDAANVIQVVIHVFYWAFTIQRQFRRNWRNRVPAPLPDIS